MVKGRQFFFLPPLKPLVLLHLYHLLCLVNLVLTWRNPKLPHNFRMIRNHIQIKQIHIGLHKILLRHVCFHAWKPYHHQNVWTSDYILVITVDSHRSTQAEQPWQSEENWGVGQKFLFKWDQYKRRSLCCKQLSYKKSFLQESNGFSHSANVVYTRVSLAISFIQYIQAYFSSGVD